MDRQAAAQGLRALATGSAKRSKAAQLRDLLEDVEAALVAGVKRSAVVDELAKHGLQMNLATFDSALRRLRRKCSGQVNQPSPAAAARASKPGEVAASSRASRSLAAASPNPGDIDRIASSTPDLDALAKHAKRKNK